MLSRRLIKLIETHAETLTQKVVEDLLHNEHTRAHVRIPKNELGARSAITFRGGPSKEQIKQDISSSMEQACMRRLKIDNQPYAKVDDIEIESTKVYNNEATVRASVEYHWIGTPTKGEAFADKPCNYFNGQSIKSVAEPTLIYRMSDSNWKLAEIR